MNILAKKFYRQFGKNTKISAVTAFGGDHKKMIKKNIIQLDEILNKDALNPIWLSVSEAAKLGGVQTKTIRRAVQSKEVKYKIIKNRYFIEFASIILFLHKNTKLKNKLYTYGIGRYFVSQKSES